MYVLLVWRILVAWCSSLPCICMQQLSQGGACTSMLSQTLTVRKRRLALMVPRPFLAVLSSYPQKVPTEVSAVIAINKQVPVGTENVCRNSLECSSAIMEVYLYSKILKKSYVENWNNWIIIVTSVLIVRAWLPWRPSGKVYCPRRVFRYSDLWKVSPC